MTDPNDPYAPPPPGSSWHPQENMTQPVPYPSDTASTPVDPPRPPTTGPYAVQHQPYQGYTPSASYVPPAGPEQPTTPYQQASYQASSPQVANQMAVYPQQGYAYPQQGYAYPEYAVRPASNGMAIAALVLGILWLYWIGSILALIFGYVALRQIRSAPPESPQGGRGIALAGVILGWVGIATLVLTVLFLVSLSMSY